MHIQIQRQAVGFQNQLESVGKCARVHRLAVRLAEQVVILIHSFICCLLIMRNLLQRPWRFNELKKDLEGISQKVLTDSLRSMEADGIITRTVYPEVPPRVEYALSDLGESMRPIMDAMEIWGTEYKKSKE